MVKFMEKRRKKYPKYSSRWDPTRSRKENEDREKLQPGAQPGLFDFEGDDSNTVDEPSAFDAPLYPEEAYPDWYQPTVNASFEEPPPDLTQPTGNSLSWNGPDISDVVGETSDGSPLIEDCVHAFGSLKIGHDLEAVHGKKGETWWAGVRIPIHPHPAELTADDVPTRQYVHSCALAIFYEEDWSDECKATEKNVDDHASAVFAKCQNPGNGKVGGRVSFVKDKCPAQIQIIKTGGQASRPYA